MTEKELRIQIALGTLKLYFIGIDWTPEWSGKPITVTASERYQETFFVPGIDFQDAKQKVKFAIETGKVKRPFKRAVYTVNPASIAPAPASVINMRRYFGQPDLFL